MRKFKFQVAVSEAFFLSSTLDVWGGVSRLISYLQGIQDMAARNTLVCLPQVVVVF